MCSFLYPQASSTSTTIEDQLHDLLHMPPEQIRDEMVMVWQGRELPRAARDMIAAGSSGPQLIADAIWQYWEVAIATRRGRRTLLRSGRGAPCDTGHAGRAVRAAR